MLLLQAAGTTGWTAITRPILTACRPTSPLARCRRPLGQQHLAPCSSQQRTPQCRHTSSVEQPQAAAAAAALQSAREAAGKCWRHPPQLMLQAAVKTVYCKKRSTRMQLVAAAVHQHQQGVAQRRLRACCRSCGGTQAARSSWCGMCTTAWLHGWAVAVV